MPRRPCSRRHFTSQSLAVSAAALVSHKLPVLAADARPAAPAAPLNRFPRMVQEYYVAKLRENEHRSLAALDKLKTAADAEAYVRQARAKIQACFGPWPERTPLNPRTTGVVDRDTYRIEKIIFESRPKFYVTGNLYVPNKASFPAPAVVGVCGHSPNGKAWTAYQSFCQGLARQGYVAFIIDPLGQGERLQLVNDELKSRIYPGTGEHLMLGNQQLLVGEFLGSWRAWDGIRALDYLLTREEVDPKHVGITGSSGGGTMTTWLAGVDQRWAMAAPSSFVTTFRRNMENELPADTEQCPPGALARGLEQFDFLVALAPKPVIVLAQELDNFDARGSAETVERLKRVYKLLGHEDNASLYVGPGPHGYGQDAREAMYACFNRACDRDASSSEPPLVIEDEQTLWCTPKGQVAAIGSRPVFSFTRDIAASQARGRGSPSGNALIAAVRETLKPGDRVRAPDFRILRPRKGRFQLPWNSFYALETEPGILSIVTRPSAEPHHSRPPRATNRVILYVAHDSSDRELGDEPLLGELTQGEPAATLYACDVRGLGESRPNTCGDNTYASAYGCDYFYAIHAVMLERPYIGRRTHDVLATIDWLLSFGHRDVHLIGKGYGSLPAAFAALLHPRVAQVTLKNAPKSYTDIVNAELYKWPLSSFVPGVLKHFDLPDVYRELGAKRLRLIEPWGADLKPA